MNNGSDLIEKTALASEGIELKDLDYGTYHLTITAKNQKGIESTNTLNYYFSIANPLINSIWLYVIIIASIGLWTFVVILMTKAKLKKDMIIKKLVKHKKELNKIVL